MSQSKYQDKYQSGKLPSSTLNEQNAKSFNKPPKKPTKPQSQKLMDNSKKETTPKPVDNPSTKRDTRAIDITPVKPDKPASQKPMDISKKETMSKPVDNPSTKQDTKANVLTPMKPDKSTSQKFTSKSRGEYGLKPVENTANERAKPQTKKAIPKPVNKRLGQQALRSKGDQGKSVVEGRRITATPLLFKPERTERITKGKIIIIDDTPVSSLRRTLDGYKNDKRRQFFPYPRAKKPFEPSDSSEDEESEKEVVQNINIVMEAPNSTNIETIPPPEATAHFPRSAPPIVGPKSSSKPEEMKPIVKEIFQKSTKKRRGKKNKPAIKTEIANQLENPTHSSTLLVKKSVD